MKSSPQLYERAIVMWKITLSKAELQTFLKTNKVAVDLQAHTKERAITIIEQKLTIIVVRASYRLNRL